MTYFISALTFAVLIGSSLAHDTYPGTVQNPEMAQAGNMAPAGQSNVNLPSFLGNFFQNLNNGQGQQPPPNQPEQAMLPVRPPARQPPIQPPMMPAQSAPMRIPINQQQGIPNVYGPLSANWSSCPNGFDCCGRLVYADSANTLQCCGEGSFDRRYQKCERGVISALSASSAAAAAAAAPVPLARLNCGGYLFVADQTYRCCNFDVYDPSVQQCRDGKIENLPPPTMPALPAGSVYIVCGNYKYILACGATLTWGCCGQDLYNYNTENCTTEGISPPRTPVTQSQVPAAQGLLVFCSAVRYWVDPAGLTTIRCCGSRLCSAMYQPALYEPNRSATVPMGPFSEEMKNTLNKKAD